MRIGSQGGEAERIMDERKGSPAARDPALCLLRPLRPDHAGGAGGDGQAAALLPGLRVPRVEPGRADGDDLGGGGGWAGGPRGPGAKDTGQGRGARGGAAAGAGSRGQTKDRDKGCDRGGVGLEPNNVKEAGGAVGWAEQPRAGAFSASWAYFQAVGKAFPVSTLAALRSACCLQYLDLIRIYTKPKVRPPETAAAAAAPRPAPRNQLLRHAA